jgi:hypothetical protein
VLPLSIVGGVGLKISARIGYSQIWLHKIQLGQSWLQAQEGVEDQSPTVDCGSTKRAAVAVSFLKADIARNAPKEETAEVVKQISQPTISASNVV